MPPDPYRYFRPEATDLVGQLGSGFLELEKKGAEPALLSKLFRIAHTLKGAARIVKHKDIADLTHALETWMAPLRDGGALPARLDEPLALVDKMAAHVAALVSPAAPAPVPVVATPVAAAPAVSAAAPSRGLGDVLDGLAELQVQLAKLRTLEDLRHLPARIEALEREVRRVREDTEQLQLVAAGALFPSLERLVRDTAQSVDFVGSGGDTRLETAVRTTLYGALVQLVRNAIAHGIESASQRVAAGKPARATISMDVSQQAGRVTIRVADDGRGIDLAAVRRALDKKGVAAPALSDHDGLIRALLSGGISTAASVTQMSGRGVGLDVVSDVARQLGGELTATTVPGQGTTFVLSIPVSMATLHGVVLAGGAHVVVVPLANVRTVLALKPQNLVRSERAVVLVHDDASVPFGTIAQLLGGAPHPVTTVALVDRGNGELVALGAERVLGVRDVLQRSRPRGVALDPVVAGLVIDDEGIPRPVLDATELHRVVRGAAVEPVAPTKRPLPILVIDDSLTTRMLEQSILESAGYQVELASSAEEGLAKAQRGKYALFLVDVEMPGMDGFTFVATTRADPELRRTPAILVSSRNAPEDFRRGTEAGAKGYMVKGDFDQQALLALIGRLV